MIRRLHSALLRGAAFLVRAPEREEWLAEWRAELGYVPRERRTSFCLGAPRDALWLRRHGTVRPIFLQSPWRCLLFLASLTALSLFFALRISLVREMLFSPMPDGLSTISGISPEDYRHLPIDRSGVAFYGTAHSDSGELPVALASSNLFDLMRLPLVSTEDAPLILSQSAWRGYFHSDPHIAGRRLTVAGRRAQVAGVIPDEIWELPGRAAAWLIVDEASLDAEPVGYVVARVDASARRIGRFRCVPLMPRGLWAYLLMILISAAIVPAVISVHLGDYPASRHASGTIRLRRWIFLAVKLALILPLVLLGSLDVFSLIAIGIQPHAMIVGTVIGLRWALMDQRRRCPICLRILSNPTSIGEPSRTLLEWYGTELICGRGHGLLHVPELHNSYSEQRWLHLDASWSSLFACDRTS